MKRNIAYILYMGILWALALPAQAYTEVTNTVVTEANTGGGGTGTAYTKVYTEVNGEVVTDIEEEKTSTDGSSVIIEKDIHTVIDNDGVVKTEAKAEIGGAVNDGDGIEETMEEMLEERVEEVEIETGTNVAVLSRIKIFFKTYVFWWL